MHQLFRSSLGWNKVEPPARPHSVRQAKDMLRDGIASAKIIKKPAVDARGPQIALDFLDVCSHWGFSSIARTRFNCHASSILHQQCKDLMPAHTAVFDAFLSASHTAQHSTRFPG